MAGGLIAIQRWNRSSTLTRKNQRTSKPALPTLLQNMRTVLVLIMTSKNWIQLIYRNKRKTAKNFFAGLHLRLLWMVKLDCSAQVAQDQKSLTFLISTSEESRIQWVRCQASLNLRFQVISPITYLSLRCLSFLKAPVKLSTTPRSASLGSEQTKNLLIRQNLWSLSPPMTWSTSTRIGT